MDLSYEQESARKTILERTGHNIFVSGYAGSGKTTLLRQIIQDLRNSGVRTAASTGLAAQHLGGITIAKLLGLRLAKNIDDFGMVKLEQAAFHLDNIRVVVLDEVSMISGDMLELIDYVMREAKGVDQPFGGVRMIFSGDFLQLPPIHGYNQPELRMPWAFEYSLFTESLAIFLEETHRQGAEDFKILNELRQGIITPAGKSYLAEMAGRQVKGATFLHPRRKDVDAINQEHLKQLPGQTYYYPTQCSDPDAWKVVANQIPIGEKVLLKKDAPVLILMNDPKGHFVNGSQGRVLDVWRNSCRIRLNSGPEVLVPLKTWEIHLPGRDTPVRATGLPIQLGWAATIHRAQGMTLDAVSADLGNCWEPGQAYVALSRTRSLKQVALTGVPLGIQVDPVALSYSNNLI